MKKSDGPPESRAARISRYLAWLSGGILLVGCAGSITVDVVLRYFLNRTVVESFEISGYAFAAAVALGMAYTISCKSNIRIDLVANRLPLRPRVILDLVAHLAILAVAATIAWYALQTWLQSLKLDAKSVTILQVPLILPQGIWLLGLLWFALFAALVAWSAARLLWRGDLAGVQALIGPATLQDEIELAGAPAKDAE
jgi:TRAP-type C4-dicarboxylate transport system permease small subunit